MNDLIRLITLQDYNTRVVLAGVGVLGATCGIIGTCTVLRGRALVADALAHAALPGVCLAFLVLGERSLGGLLLGALAMGLVGSLVLTWLRKATPVKEDAAIALTLSTTFGLGICLLASIQRSPSAAHAGLEGFIFGKASAMTFADVRALAGVCAALLVACGLGWRQLRVLCFDPGFGAAAGMPMARMDLALLALVALGTVAALPAVGLVLVVALLTIPAAAARFWTDDFTKMALIAAGLGALSGVLGAAISALARDLSTGPVVVLVAAGLFMLSMALAPGRGLLPAMVRRRRQRRAIALQNLLRAAYEVGEANGSGHVHVHEVLAKRAWSRPTLEALLARARRAGLVRVLDDARIELTSAGQAQACALVRTHRLWELYLIEHASIAPDHVDRDADQAEHLIAPHVLDEFEARLRAQGRMPADLAIAANAGQPHAPTRGTLPSSPHAIAPADRAGPHA